MARLALLSAALLLFFSGPVHAHWPAGDGATDLHHARYPRLATIGHTPAAKVVAAPDPISEHVGVLVIYARFVGETSASAWAPPDAADLLNPDRPGSLAHFYREMSHGLLSIGGRVLPRRYTSADEAATYLSPQEGKNGNYGRFVLEILRRADADVDFGQFDNDGPDGVPNSGDDDGIVDYVSINARSTPRGFLRDGATGIAGLGFGQSYETRDAGARGSPILVNSGRQHGSVQREGTFRQTVGAMAHEFGHRLGLPDLYDKSFLSDPQQDPALDSGGIGRWGIMGWGSPGWTGNDGPVPFSAWSLEQLGWLGPDNARLVTATCDTVLVLEDYWAGGNVLRLPIQRYTSPSGWTHDEYYLLEHRRRSGSWYNRGIPGEGVLLWHVRSGERHNDDEAAKVVDLVCADGLWSDAAYPVGVEPSPQHGSDNLDYWAHDNVYSDRHAGNLGDATDPWDGQRFTRFDALTNPGNHPRGWQSEASTGIGLAFGRQGSSIRVDVRQPRWAGELHGDVHWSGDVLIDGDLQVCSDAQLTVHGGTRVRFAGGDRLRSGRDPNASEIEIHGSVHLAPRGGDPVVFEGLEPGDQWYGIVLAADVAAEVRMEEGAYLLRDAVEGFVFPGAPGGVSEMALQRTYTVDDAPAGSTAGNGDGRPAPGEVVVIEPVLSNWTLETFRHVDFEMAWSSPLVQPLFDTGQVGYVGISDPVDLHPGSTQALRLPPLRIDPQARPGDILEFVVSLESGTRHWRDTLAVRLGEQPHSASVRARFDGREPDQGAALVHCDGRASVEMTISDPQIARADLVVWTWPEHQLAREISLRNDRPSAGPDQHYGELHPLPAGRYEARVRLTDTSGGVSLAPGSLDLWSVSPRGRRPLVVFADGVSHAASHPLAAFLRDLAAARGMGLHLVSEAPASGALYGQLLPHYLARDAVVLWLGGPLTGAQRDLGEFAAAGGALGLFSSQVAGSLGGAAFLGQVALVDEVHSAWGSLRPLGSPSEVRSIFYGDSTIATTQMASLDALPGAIPWLTDQRGDLLGVLRDSGGYRTAYVPYGLLSAFRINQDLGALLSEAVAFLTRPALPTPTIHLAGAEEREGRALQRGSSTVSVEVSGTDEVAGVSIQVRGLPGLAPLSEVPLQLGSPWGPPVWGGQIQLPGPGLYQLFAQVRVGQERYTTGGGVHLACTAAELPILALVGGPTLTERTAKRRWLDKSPPHLVDDMSVVDVTDLDRFMLETLLEQQLDDGDAVVWLGGAMDTGVQGLLSRYLSRGGRLLTTGLERYSQPTFRREVLGIAAMALYGDDTLVSPCWDARAVVPHYTVTPAPGAFPVLYNSSCRVAGVQFEDGRRRLVFLPFELGALAAQDRDSVLAGALRFLRDGPVTATLAVGDESGHLRAGETFTVQLETGAEVHRARLQVLELPQLSRTLEVPLQPNGNGTFTGQAHLPQSGRFALVPTLLDRSGEALTHSTSLDIIASFPDRPLLALLAPHSDRAFQQAARAATDSAVRAAGQTASIVEPWSTPPDLLNALLQAHLPGPVMWISSQLDPQDGDVLASYLGAGGRLLLSAGQMAGSSILGPQLRAALSANRLRRARPRALRSTHLDLEPDLVLPAGLLEPLAPAQPFLFDDQGNVVAHTVGTDSSRLVLLALDLREAAPPVVAEITSYALDFLQEHSPALGPIQVEGTDDDADPVLLVSGQTTQVRVQAGPEVREVHLVARGLPEREILSRRLMLPAGDGYPSAALNLSSSLLDVELSLEATDTQGEAISGGSGRRCLVLHPELPALVLLDPSQSDAQLAATRAALEASLVEAGLPALFCSTADRGDRDLAHLLAGRQDPGQLVVWAGRRLREPTQRALRDHVETGGRLLVASLGLPFTAGVDGFLDTVLAARSSRLIRTETISGAGWQVNDFDLRFMAVAPLTGATPSLVSPLGHVSAVRRVADAGRTSFMAFDPGSPPLDAFRSLAGPEIRFLMQASALPARVVLHAIEGPSLATQGRPYQAFLSFANQGDTPSPIAVVAYECTNPVATQSGQVTIPSLAPREVRRVPLPPWVPQSEGPSTVAVDFPLQSGRAGLLRLTVLPPLAPYAIRHLDGDAGKANGAAFFDADGDGDSDLLVVRRNAEDLFYRTQGGQLRPEHVGLSDPGRGRAAAIGDPDGDGDLDVYLVREVDNTLYRNDGSGLFSPLAASDHGAGDPEGQGRGAAFFDADQDGDLDLLVVNHRPGSYLFLNEEGLFRLGDGLVDDGFGRGLALSDVDGDGDTDVFIANTLGGSYLHLNRRGRFAAVAPEVSGLHLEDGSVAADFGDVDGDGDFDLIVANEYGPSALFTRQAGTFSRVDSVDLGQKCVGTAFVDVDNDGDLDLFSTSLGYGDQVYHNAGNLVAVAPQLGLSQESQGRAVSFADVDGDGVLEIMAADYRGARLYVGGRSDAHWVDLALVGSPLNRFGVGSLVAVHSGQGVQVRELRGSLGYAAFTGANLHVGLGRAAVIDSVVVRWPGDATTTHLDVAADTRVELTAALAGRPAPTGPGRPEAPRLHVHPNPANSTFNIGLHLARAGHVCLTVHNALGQQVACLLDGVVGAGVRQVSWDGFNRQQRPAASGVYFLCLRTDRAVVTRRLVLLR